MKPPRVVLDTNVVISALLFKRGTLSWIREAWARGLFVPLASRETTLELLRVLSYPKFNLSHEEREDVLGEYLPFCEIVRVDRVPARLPECRDPYDQMFIDLAVVGRADLIVTGDDDLLALKGARVGRAKIVTPERFRGTVG